MKTFTVLLPKGFVYTQETQDTYFELLNDYLAFGVSHYTIEDGKLIRIPPSEWVAINEP